MSIFFFKQKTAYEMRISDWSSDVCSSDLDLAIDKVEGEGKDGAWQPLQYGLADRDELHGSKFTIEAPERNEHIRVTYTTSPDASGLQRMTPAQPEGGKLRSTLSQLQHNHARSWVPPQATPQVRPTTPPHGTT